MENYIKAKAVYELSPRDGRKSFYGKARVFVAGENDIGLDEGAELLISYNSVICARDMRGEIERFPCAWTERDNWSATTGRHIAAFCGLNKKEFLDLPLCDINLTYCLNKIEY